MQGNKIAALDPSQEADKVLTRSPKPANSEDSDPMDFDNKVLETLAHLDHTPTPPTINKIPPILPPQPKPESWFVREERKIDRGRSWGAIHETQDLHERIIAVQNNRQNAKICRDSTQNIFTNFRRRAVPHATVNGFLV